MVIPNGIMKNPLPTSRKLEPGDRSDPSGLPGMPGKVPYSDMFKDKGA